MRRPLMLTVALLLVPPGSLLVSPAGSSSGTVSPTTPQVTWQGQDFPTGASGPALDVPELGDPAVRKAVTLAHLNPQTQEALPGRAKLPTWSSGDVRVAADHVATENVRHIRTLRLTSDGVGARVVGHYLYVTSTKDLQIYDISTPENPRLVSVTPDVEFENEEVPTNGTILGISGEIGCKDPANSNVTVGVGPTTGTGCLSLYDVSDPARVKFIRSVAGSGEHTSSCLLDCRYFWGSEGAVTDATDPPKTYRMKDPTNPLTFANWLDHVAGQLTERDPVLFGRNFDFECHNQREITPGIVIGACQPIVLVSIRAENGGSVTQPKLLAYGANADGRFIHSARWPREGQDRFALIGGESNFTGICDDNTGAFMTWDATRANSDGTFTMIDEYRLRNGTYLDGNPPVNVLGCSVHWFAEHPTFRNGGLVALAAFENGMRFLRVTDRGEIQEVGFFQPLGGSTSAAHWAPNSNIVYSVDYLRGLDVLEWTGPR